MHDADSSSVQSPQSLSPELKAALDNFIQQHKVVLFMKGTKQFPQVPTGHASHAYISLELCSLALKWYAIQVHCCIPANEHS